VIKPEETLTEAIQKFIELPADTLQEKAFSARKAAEQLNRDTIYQWAEILARYTR
jgi:hypothetical protein